MNKVLDALLRLSYALDREGISSPIEILNKDMYIKLAIFFERQDSFIGYPRSAMKTVKNIKINGAHGVIEIKSYQESLR